MTATQAARLNKMHDWTLWKRGDSYPGFDSKEEIIGLALSTWKERFPEGELLIKGDRVTAEPQMILMGPWDVKERTNAMVLRAEEIGWWDADAEMQAIWDEWNELLAPFRGYKYD